MSDPKTGVSNEKNKRDDNVSNQDVGAPCSVVRVCNQMLLHQLDQKGKTET